MALHSTYCVTSCLSHAAPKWEDRRYHGLAARIGLWESNHVFWISSSSTIPATWFLLLSHLSFRASVYNQTKGQELALWGILWSYMVTWSESCTWELLISRMWGWFHILFCCLGVTWIWFLSPELYAHEEKIVCGSICLGKLPLKITKRPAVIWGPA